MTSHDDEVIAAFRAAGGDVGGAYGGMPMLLMHHRGARSGVERVSPLVHWRVSDTTLAVLASNFGSDSHPSWYYNLLAHPITTIELGASTWTIEARVASEQLRAELLTHMRRASPSVEQAVRRTDRSIPVVVLDLKTQAPAPP
jgi:deazaflavin-dependent oxidoreductase (nitroreductase family)